MSVFSAAYVQFDVCLVCQCLPKPPSVSAHVCVNASKNFSFRYKLLRRKIQQPLATASVPTETAPSPPPPEDLHRWLHVYSGTKLFYQDKGLSR